jgi:uncharacterized integral membrane protein
MDWVILCRHFMDDWRVNSASARKLSMGSRRARAGWRVFLCGALFLFLGLYFATPNNDH